jgi:uncharacterized protein YkwD
MYAERAKAGVGALRVDPRLMVAARVHSRNMAAQEKMAHELDGKNFDSRVKAEGYEMRAGGENVAAGQRTAAEAVEGWIGSEGHRKNMLNGDYEDVGVGVAEGKDGKRYWTQVFASPFKP